MNQIHMYTWITHALRKHCPRCVRRAIVQNARALLSRILSIHPDLYVRQRALWRNMMNEQWMNVLSSTFLILGPSGASTYALFKLLHIPNETFKQSLLISATQGTPRVQFAIIRKMVLCQGLPHCLHLRVDLIPKVSSLHAWLQNLDAF